MEKAIKTVRYNPYLLALPFIIGFALYLPTLYELVLDWYNDPNYSHGFLVPVVSLYLLWQKRREIRQATLKVDNRGLVILILGMTLFILGNGAAEYFTVRFSLVVTLFGLVFYLFGRELIKKSWFEMLFLVFMIPVPYVIYFALTFPMQLLASRITSEVLNFIGLAAVRQGNVILIEGHALEVAEACSGMRSLVSLLALGALYAHLTQARMASKIILFLATIPIAVIANVFRVFVTALLVYTVSPMVTEDPWHTIMGLSVFVVAFIMLFFLGLILKQVFK